MNKTIDKTLARTLFNVASHLGDGWRSIMIGGETVNVYSRFGIQSSYTISAEIYVQGLFYYSSFVGIANDDIDCHKNERLIDHSTAELTWKSFVSEDEVYGILVQLRLMT